MLLLRRGIPPRTPNLVTLLEMVEENPPEEIRTILLRLNPHYTIARYPDAALGPSLKLYNIRIAQEFLEQTEGMGFLERLELPYSFWEPGLDADILGYTPEEFEEASQRLTLLAEVRKTGKDVTLP